MAKFKWTAQSLRAVQLVAEQGLGATEVAREVGVELNVARAWLERVDFKNEVARYLEVAREKLLREGIRSKINRLNAYNDRWQQMTYLMKARAEDLADIPGGSTGLIVRDFKGSQLIPVYKFDAAFMKEIRELEKQAAQEVGDWIEKKELSGKDGGAIPIAIQTAIDKAYGDTDESSTEIESTGQADDDGAGS